MLSDEELLLHLDDLESAFVERKRSFRLDDAKELACAFANDFPNHRGPGLIFYGIEDDGKCAHLAVDDDLLLAAGNLRADGSILPSPAIEVEKRTLAGCTVMVVMIHPHDAPPVRLNGVTWIRIGPRNQRASREEERILSERHRSRNVSFDYQPALDSTIADFDTFRFVERYRTGAVSRQVIEENERSIPEQMLSLRLTNAAGIPTYGGLLLIGKDPERYVPGAYVQFLRYEGTRLTDRIIAEKRLSGPLDEQMTSLDELLRLNLRTQVDFSTGDREIRKSDYPLVALQQLSRNAAMHRNYESNAPVKINWFEDRVEISNPGGPYGQVTTENFGSGVNDYRNPLIAEGLRYYGFVQRYGVGIPLAERALAENGNPAATFTITETNIAVTVRK